jgi:sirohydrochlorin ferrochelatase
MTRAILLIDHGSRRAEANAMLEEVAALVASASGGLVVRHAHMELASPTIAEGVRACLAAGATELVAVPYMLSPGRHALEDIPRLVREALGAHPEIRARVAPPLGVHPALAEVVLARVAESGD